MTAVYNNTYLISYVDKTAATTATTTTATTAAATTATVSTLQVLSMDINTPNIGKVMNTVDNIPYNIYEIITLNINTGLFVGICQDAGDTEETAYIISGQVDHNSYDFKLNKSPLTYTDMYSISPSITRLSDTSFAFAYFDFNSSKLVTSYGNSSYTNCSLVL